MNAQTPDWMFALEGSYIGYKSVPDIYAGGGQRQEDARLDGKRNGAEDGFVLQWMISSEEAEEMVMEHLETWHWNSDLERMVMTRIVDNRPVVENWVVTQSSSSRAVLERGGEWNGKPTLMRMTMERLPGQIRFEFRTNDGSGKWEMAFRYILDDHVIED
ncbi:MAG: hypothetical protein ACPGYK_07005 [Flavobacteriales bacterium]